MKTFCIAGPIIPKDHYYIPRRLNWDKLDSYLEKKYYFLLHAPRQSGKTSAILEYVNYLNENDKYKALYITTEAAHIAKNNIERTVYWLLEQFVTQINIQLPQEKEALDFLNKVLEVSPLPEIALYRFLEFWAKQNQKPLALFFDEVDGLVEMSLIFLLKQLRTGYTNRPKNFPQSVCLIGVRNLQDYKIKSKEEQEMGILISPFNIVANSLLLKNFTQEQVKNLYLQHTQETGQIFTEEAIEYAYYLTQGQPWLVNALAYQACFQDILDINITITKDIIESAKEKLILKRDVHIVALVDRLNEPRVRNIIDAIISGSDPLTFDPDDIQYARDLGLVKEDSWEIANPIYKQIIPRALTHVIQETLPNNSAWYIDASGNLDMRKILESFTDFFRQNADAYRAKIEYHESFPHLLLMAFLQRIVNGGGQIHREYALGRKRVDLLVIWQKKYRYVLELKVKRTEDSLSKGLNQTAEYIDICNAHEGHLLLFDKDFNKSWDEKISNELISYQNKKIHVWTM